MEFFGNKANNINLRFSTFVVKILGNLERK